MNITREHLSGLELALDELNGIASGEAYEVIYRLAEQAKAAPVAEAAACLNPSRGGYEGWKLVPIKPTEKMLSAGDGFIGTPATYTAMIAAAPKQDISKDFSQFLSAVMDAAGLVRHGRQSKELSEYLGSKCMEYMLSTAPAPAIKESLTVAEPVAWAAFAENGNIRMWCRSALGVTDMSDDHGNKAVPLYITPPHGAELVELLRDCYPGCGLTTRQTVQIRERIDTYLATLPRT